MDTTVPDIRFDGAGVCQFCRQFEERMARELYADNEGQARLHAITQKIKRRGAGREYDCLIGVSGGVDSTYVAYLVKKKHGLRPLAVHLDNGWDTELAVANVEQVLKRLDIDLYTYVLDWEEFKDLQLSFLKSSISNAEIPTDHAIWALLIRTAAERNIPYIISGSNIATEALMPESWLYGSKDARLIKGIQRQFGHYRLKSFPQLSTFDFVYFLLVRGVKWIPILNYVPYVKQEAKRVLIDELGWRDYGGKHYESIFTRFFHAYYLPRKFGYDLRRSYLSALILSGQMTRDEALREIKSPPAPADQLEEDREFVIKKLGLSPEEFEQIMTAPPKTFSDYPNGDALWRKFDSLVQTIRKRIIDIG
jgi:N-acetyl sugar amidotransferase